VSSFPAVLRRAGELLVEPVRAVQPVRPVPLEVVVTALSAGAGATTVCRGLALALRGLQPVELSGIESSGAVAAGPGIAVLRDTAPADAGLLRHRGAGRVLVAVADARREPPLAALVRDVLAARHERVLLVGNRVRDVGAWQDQRALCVPESWLGASILVRGHRPPGAMGLAFEALAALVQQAA
jgi:hypothetical protein